MTQQPKRIKLTEQELVDLSGKHTSLSRDPRFRYISKGTATFKKWWDNLDPQEQIDHLKNLQADWDVHTKDDEAVVGSVIDQYAGPPSADDPPPPDLSISPAPDQNVNLRLTPAHTVGVHTNDR